MDRIKKWYNMRQCGIMDIRKEAIGVLSRSSLDDLGFSFRGENRGGYCLFASF